MNDPIIAGILRYNKIFPNCCKFIVNARIIAPSINPVILPKTLDFKTLDLYLNIKKLPSRIKISRSTIIMTPHKGIDLINKSVIRITTSEILSHTGSRNFPVSDS